MTLRIEEILERRSRSHWLSLLAASEVPCGPINDYRDVMDDPHIRSREMVVETDHPTLGRISTLGTPLKLSDTPLTPGRPAPLLGQHTDAVLRDAGYGPAEIQSLRTSGVVK